MALACLPDNYVRYRNEGLTSACTNACLSLHGR
jgi:hypothetical protein